MSTQQTLFSINSEPLAPPVSPKLAAARRTDPASSHLAAEQMNASGEAKRQRERVVDLVFMHPGLTSKQLATKCEDLDRFQIARRLPEAEDAGDVERRAGTGKSKEVCWFPRD
jgi:hypothetical protein